MKSVLFAGTFALLGALVPEVMAENAPGFSGRRLYEACSSNEMSLHILCTAYLRGLIFGLQFGQRLDHPTCISPDPEAARLVVDKFIADHPKALEDDKGDSGDFIAIVALLRAFQCKPSAP